jgi:hypothetical protein
MRLLLTIFVMSSTSLTVHALDSGLAEKCVFEKSTANINRLVNERVQLDVVAKGLNFDPVEEWEANMDKIGEKDKKLKEEIKAEIKNQLKYLELSDQAGSALASLSVFLKYLEQCNAEQNLKNK